MGLFGQRIRDLPLECCVRKAQVRSTFARTAKINPHSGNPSVRQCCGCASKIALAHFRNFKFIPIACKTMQQKDDWWRLALRQRKRRDNILAAGLENDDFFLHLSNCG